MLHSVPWTCSIWDWIFNNGFLNHPKKLHSCAWESEMHYQTFTGLIHETEIRFWNMFTLLKKRLDLASIENLVCTDLATSTKYHHGQIANKWQEQATRGSQWSPTMQRSRVKHKRMVLRHTSFCWITVLLCNDTIRSVIGTKPWNRDELQQFAKNITAPYLKQSHNHQNFQW